MNGELATVVLGGGCFWCTEAMFRDLNGVSEVVSGYAGGSTPDPTYKEVCSGTTGHAEVVQVSFDPTVITRRDLFTIHLLTHDPTTPNRQGGDVGTQYRSVIFFSSDEEREEATDVIHELDARSLYDSPIVTTLEPLTTFFPAEDYHQRYLEKFEAAGPLQRMSFNAGYCTAVVAPKVAKFRKAFSDRLRAGSASR